MKKQSPIVMDIYENPEAMPKHGEYRKIIHLIGQQLGYIDIGDKAKRFGPTEEFRLVEGYRRQRHVVLFPEDDDVVFLTRGTDANGKVCLEAYVPEGDYDYKTVMKIRRTDPRVKVTKPTSTEKDVAMQVHVKTESLREMPRTGMLVDFIKLLNEQDGYTDRDNKHVPFGEVAYFRAMVGFRNRKWIEFVPESGEPKDLIFLTVSDGKIMQEDDPRVNGSGNMLARITRSHKAAIPTPPRADLAKRLLDSDGLVGNALGGAHASKDERFDKRHSEKKTLSTGEVVHLFCDNEEEMESVLSMYNTAVWSAIQEVLINRDNKAMVQITLGCTQAGVKLYMRVNDHSTTDYFEFDSNRFTPTSRDKIEEELAVLDVIWQQGDKEAELPEEQPKAAVQSKVEWMHKARGTNAPRRAFGAGLHEPESGPERDWIPQMNQFVRVEGMKGAYVIADYDDFAEMFVVRMADSCRREREAQMNPDAVCLRVPGNALRPIALKY